MDLEPNKIHHLPVRVTYTLPVPSVPSSEPQFYSTGYTCPPREDSGLQATYTTTCRGLVPVFVHDVQDVSHRRKRRKMVKEEGGEDVVEAQVERTATVCLKSLIKAICLSSPETIPSQYTSDLKIYTRSSDKNPPANRLTRARHLSVTSAHLNSTPGLSSSRTRSSSSIPESEADFGIPPSFYPHPYAAYPSMHKAVATDGLQCGYPSSTPYVTHHPHLATPIHNTHTIPAISRQEQILQPKSTIASILLEKNAGKTTVTGTLIPAESHMLESALDETSTDGLSGLEALEKLLGSGITAVLDVQLVFSSPMKTDGSSMDAYLDAERERDVYQALGLACESPSNSGARSVDVFTDVTLDVPVKAEPDWTDSNSDLRIRSVVKTEPRKSSARPTFRPFRPTTSKMAIFESQTQKRNQGMNGRRGLHQIQSDSEQTSPSTIFSRTRSRTRLGMGTTMLEQVLNVDNVVRLARKNPSALVERFLSGHPATSPVKSKGNGSGFTIAVLPNLGRAASTVKTLNIATGSSKKRKVVSVVLDDEGRPVRWGAGMASSSVNMNAAGGARDEVETEARGHEGPSKSKAVVANKKTEPEPLVHFGRNLPICSNCGITESSSWRTKGKGGQRVCNACGLYWNTKGKMRPKELWEKDIARWKKRRAKAADKAAATTTTGTPAATIKETVAKTEPLSAHRPSAPQSSTKITQSNPSLAVPQSASGTSLKRNLSAIAEKEAQLRADQRKSHVKAPRAEHLASASAGSRNKENTHDQHQSHPRMANPGKPSAEPSSNRLAPSALQPVNVNDVIHTSAPLIQQLKESPEAVLKRYLGETPFSLVPANHMPLSDDGSRGSRANTRTRSPATSPTEVGSVRHSQEDPIEWGTAPDLAGLFRFSQQAESVTSLATTVNRPQEYGVSSIEADVGGHLGSDEFTMMEVDDPQTDLMQHDDPEFGILPDTFGTDLPVAPHSAQSSPAHQPFDWKDLPPSSPPMMYDDEVDHAAALWSSSPETSPVDFGTISVKDITPMKPVGEDMQDLLQSLERSAQAEALRLINEST